MVSQADSQDGVDWAALLRRAIDRSGLPDRRYAVEVLGVNERTVRRILYGEVKVPSNLAVRAKILSDARAHSPSKKRLEL